MFRLQTDQNTVCYRRARPRLAPNESTSARVLCNPPESPEYRHLWKTIDKWIWVFWHHLEEWSVGYPRFQEILEFERRSKVCISKNFWVKEPKFEQKLYLWRALSTWRLDHGLISDNYYYRPVLMSFDVNAQIASFAVLQSLLKVGLGILSLVSLVKNDCMQLASQCIKFSHV